MALSASQADEIAALDDSTLMRRILGDPAVNVLVAVRRYEHETYSHLDAEAAHRQVPHGLEPVIAKSALAEHIAALRLVDNHVHGYWLSAGDRSRFENGLNEANTEPLAEFDSGFDTPLGFAVRAHCAPLLGLPAHAEPQRYWDRRCELSEPGLARVFLPAAGVSDWLVDTGLPGDIAGLTEMSAASGGCAHEVVRLEQVAEQAAATPGDYASAFRETLHERAQTAVATKSVLAYRGGFDGDLSEPSAAAVADAAARWRDDGGTRLTDRVLVAVRAA